MRNDTKSRVLFAAQGLVQRYGYNGFSFQHVADLVGVKKPSLYDHYKSKEELGEALIEDYHEQFEIWIRATNVFGSRDKVMALFELFYEFSRDDRKFCPLTALVSDVNSLPAGMCTRLRKMHRLQKNWLQRVIESGKKTKEFKNRSSSAHLAELLMSLAYGAQLSARIAKDPRRIRKARDQALSLLDKPVKI
jgi:TetR/AcrR family transcriptional repressor of nem operon